MQRDLKKLKQVTKETSETKCLTPRSHILSPEPPQQTHRTSTPLLSRCQSHSQDNFQSTFLSELSLTFQITNSEIISNISQALQQLENHLLWNSQKSKNSELRTPRHKYLRGPLVTEDISEPKRSISTGNSNPLHEIFVILKSKWLDSNSKFQSILLSVSHLGSSRIFNIL